MTADLLRPTPHPLLPSLTEEQIRNVIRTQEGRVKYVDWYRKRERRLAEAVEDPLYAGFALSCWKRADAQLADPDLEMQVNFGWNRGGGKTWRALRLLCLAALEYPAEGDAGYLVLGETEQSLQFVQMPKVWEFLRRHIAALNGRHGTRYKVTHKPGTGFTEGLTIVPSGPIFENGVLVGYRAASNIWFDTYKSDPGRYEGREFGGRLPEIGRTASGRAILGLSKLGADAAGTPGTPIENVGVVLDENAGLNWLRMIHRRARYRSAKIIWSYTPIKGITPAIKDVVGSAKIESTAPADAEVTFPGFVANAPGCPPGHMPVTATASWERTKIIWFHISKECFSAYDRAVFQDCLGKSSEYIERFAFGYARDSVGRQFGNFGRWNVIEPEDLPEVGTDYCICDPGIEKPYFIIYVRVSPGLGGRLNYYVWRDWPDAQRYGEWAIPTEREVNEDKKRGWDGDPGPAQSNLDMGWTQYKLLFIEIETVIGQPGGQLTERDPKRRKIQAELKPGEKRRMRIREYIIDSRAGGTKTMKESGQTCPVWEFEKEHKDPRTGNILPGISFRTADGSLIDLNSIRELLDLRRDEAGAIVTPPRLLVTSNCKQVIWALENYTGYSGEAGACKDPVDDVRYMANAELRHVEPGMVKVVGGGWGGY